MPPLVPGKFFIGNYCDLKKEDVHLSLTRLGVNYDHLFTINVFGKLMVVLNTRQAVTKVLSSKTLEFSNRPNCFLTQLATNNSKDLVFSKPNIQWLQLRTAFHKFFSEMKKLHDRKDITEIVFADEWPQLYLKLETLSNSNQPYEIKPFVYDFQVKVIAIILFGEEIVDDHEMLKEIKKLDTMSKDVISSLYKLILNMNPFESLIDNTSLSVLCKALKLQKKLMSKIFEKVSCRARNSTTSENICLKSIVDLLLPLLNVEKPLFNQVHIKNVLTELIFAGVDGTVNTVNTFMLYMCLYPKIQSRVYAEICDKVKGDFVGLGNKKNLAYTEACICETFRLSTQIPLGIFRQTVTRTQLFDYEIPEGTVLIPNVWKVNHEEENYAKPYEFIPERFLDPVTFEFKKEENFVFGGGKRGCPGKNVALNLIFLYVTNMIKNFEFKIIDNTSGDPRNFLLKSNLEPEKYKIVSVCRQSQSVMNLLQMTPKKSEVKSLCTDRGSLIKSIQENKLNFSDDEA
nr:cytochrome P450 3048A1 [Brachionus rubens]